MAGKPIRLRKAAGELNVGLPTLVEFLESKGIKIDSNPNTRLEQEHFELLCQEFKAVYDDAIQTGTSDPLSYAIAQIVGSIKKTFEEDNQKLRQKMNNTRNQIRAINRNQEAVTQAYIRKDIAWVERYRKLLKDKEEAFQEGKEVERASLIKYLQETISDLENFSNFNLIRKICWILRGLVNTIQNQEHLKNQSGLSCNHLNSESQACYGISKATLPNHTEVVIE